MKKRSREEWARIVAEFNKSGQKKKDFARARGLHPGTFSWWVTAFKLGHVRGEQLGGEADADAVRLLDVMVRAPAVTAPAGCIEVVLDGVTVRFPPGTEASYLGAVVLEIKSLC